MSTINIDEVKSTVCARIDALSTGLLDVSHDIHAHPELNYEEHHAHAHQSKGHNDDQQAQHPRARPGWLELATGSSRLKVRYTNRLGCLGVKQAGNSARNSCLRVPSRSPSSRLAGRYAIMSETSARASRFALVEGSFLRNGLMTRPEGSGSATELRVGAASGATGGAAKAVLTRRRETAGRIAPYPETALGGRTDGGISPGNGTSPNSRCGTAARSELIIASVDETVTVPLRTSS